MSDNRRQFLDRVRQALQRKTTHGLPEVGYTDLPEPLVSEPGPDILTALAKNAEEANISMTCVADNSAACAAIETIVKETAAEWESQDAVIAWDHPLLDGLGLKNIVEALGVEFFKVQTNQSEPLTTADREAFRNQLIKSKIGITSADYCIAQTSTLVQRTRPGQPGAVSLVPSVHVAVIRASQVLTDFVSFYALLEQKQTTDPDALTHRMTMISGPSKTGDIELVMVHGAHGPRALHLIVIDDLNDNSA